MYRIKSGRYYPAKKEQQKGTLRISQPIYNNNSAIVADDSSGLHPSTNGKYDI